MTVTYESDQNAVVENYPHYASYDDDGRLVLDVAEMPNQKLQNMKHAIEAAIEAGEQ